METRQYTLTRSQLVPIGIAIYENCIIMERDLLYRIGLHSTTCLCGDLAREYENYNYRDPAAPNRVITLCNHCNRVLLYGFGIAYMKVTSDNCYRMFSAKCILGSDIASNIIKNLAFRPKILHECN